MGNLDFHSTRLGDPRPFQLGRIEGTKSGAATQESKEWLVDTGAEVSVITKDNADKFDLHPTGATARATSGGAGIIMKSGLKTVFTVLDMSGANVEKSSTLPVGVKPNNLGSEILGMDQLADKNAKVRWDPNSGAGDLYE